MSQRLSISVAVLIASTISQVHGQETLKWRFQPGENRTFTMQQESKSTTTAAGASSSTSTATSMVVAWNVRQVSDDGSAQVQQTIEQVTLKMNMPGIGDVSYDSAAPHENLSPVLAGSLAMMKPLLDSPWSFTMNQQGTITEMSGTEKLDAAALEVTERAKVAALPSFKHTAEQVSAVLPESPVQPGQTWTLSNTVNSPIGKMSTRTTYTFVGNVVADGRTLKKIVSSGKLSLEPFAAAPAQMELKEGVLHGTILFDNEIGCLVNQLSTVSMTVTINGATELETVQEMRLSINK